MPKYPDISFTYKDNLYAIINYKAWRNPIVKWI